MTDQTCEKCRKSDKNELGDIVCVNYKSLHCADFVDAGDHCEKWEADHD